MRGSFSVVTPSPHDVGFFFRYDMQLNFIYSDNKPLVKNLITGESYPLVSKVTSASFAGDGIQWIYTTLKLAADIKGALLTGKLKQPLVNESRAGKVEDDPTQLLVIDVDKALNFNSRDEFLNAIGINCSYVFQHSSRSKSIDSIEGHYFIELDQPTPREQIKRWFRHLNLTQFVDDLTLSSSRLALKWPLDPIVNDAARIVYIAPPICEHDPIKERIILIEKDTDSFSVPDVQPPDTETFVNQLRQQTGLKPRELNGKSIIKVTPEEVKIDEYKENNGFYYFNINGGDSWTYYARADAPDVVSNFKDEPRFRLKDADPDLHAKLQPELPMSGQPIVLGENQEPITLKPMVFREPHGDIYFQILHHENEVYQYYKTSGKTKLRDFMISNGGPAPGIIQDWTVEFNPCDHESLRIDKQWMNLFRPTPYMTISNKTAEMPVHCERLIRHLCVDEETYNHFINWLAFIYQTRQKSGTAWLFHGTTGTGKGTLFNKILQPIFGHAHTHSCTIEHAIEDKNEHMEQCLIMFIDEFDISDLTDSSKAFNKLKNYITEEWLTIRAMRTRQKQAKNFTNVIMGTNADLAIKIDESDRRINFPPRQNQSLTSLPEWRDKIDGELISLCEFLNNVQVDERAARTPLKNKTRESMIEAGRNSHEEFFHAFKNGEIEFFLDHIQPQLPLDELVEYTRFEAIIQEWIDQAGSDQLVTINELMSVYAHICKPKQLTLIKFKHMCAHNGIVFTRSKHNNRRILGYEVVFDPPTDAHAVPERTPQHNKVVNIK